jgi:hypothetical protein
MAFDAKLTISYFSHSRPYSVNSYLSLDAFSVFTGAVYLLVPPFPLAQDTPPRDRPRGRCAFVVFNFDKISSLVDEENL